ncbi:MAG: 5-bromo-4-chloroindolyl phosphate hydrolysis family protein [Lachnospiraceae bacterium]|nr:5-bromo-4-chloroindolyl phosphate hydrolysis family protein [Lachnospiraceae bacterium]
MTKNDWYEAGDQIKRLVQDAVDTGDFSQLGNTIADVVNDTMDGLQDAIRGNLGGNRSGGWTAGGQTYDSDGSGSYDSGYGGSGASRDAYDSYDQDGSAGSSGQGGTTGDAYDQTYRGSADRVRRAYEQTADRGRQAYEQAANRGRQAYERATGRTQGQSSAQRGSFYGQSGQGMQRSQPVKAKRQVPGELGSKLMKYIGYGMGVIFGASLAMEAAAAAAIGDLFLFAAGGVTTGLLFAGSLLLGANGQRRLGESRRFKRYQEVIGTRTYCMIEELAAGIGETGNYVKKDLKKMIRRGYFPVGYLDRKETLLITDQSTYQQYLQAETEFERRQSEQEMSGGSQSSAAAQNATESEKEKTGKTERSPEHQALIEEGWKYIRHIHECNAKIPDAQMTAKLDRLELVVTRIFREAEKNPDAVSDLRKMMSYYLPTTRKLLDAYCELDDQPIRGQNIENTRKEIESALDTINTAFEKLLDDLYEEQAWDISSDISVLNSMLAQEGLTKNGFETK